MSVTVVRWQYISLVYLFLVCVVLSPLACTSWQYGPQYSYPCELTNGDAYGHFSNGLTKDSWHAQPSDTNNKFNVVPSSYIYRSNHPITFNIQSVYGMTLKGFMLQAFDRYDNRVGTWALANPSNVQPSTATMVVSNSMCATNKTNTLVHGISLAVTSFSAVWTPPPSCCTGTVRVNAMIMQQYNMYWVYNLHIQEDNSTMAPEPVRALQVADSWSVPSTNTSSATISWLPPVLTGGGGNIAIQIRQYQAIVYLGNLKVKTLIVNGSNALPDDSGFVSVGITNLLPASTYTVSVSAQTVVPNAVATQNLGVVVAAGVTLTGVAVNVTLITPLDSTSYMSPTPPANVTVKYIIQSTNNNVAAQLNSTGVGLGVTAIVTYQLNASIMATLQTLRHTVKYYAASNPGAVFSFSPSSIPTAVNGVYTISIPYLLPSTEYVFAVQIHTSGLGLVSSDSVFPGVTPGCPNSCSGVGYCHPQLVMCHCPQNRLGADCSIPVTWWDCDFSKPHDSLCMTWSVQNYNYAQNTGTVYFRVRGPMDGGFFAILFGVWLQDGMHAGEGFNIFVNPLTNETAIGAPKGQPELRPNHAQKVTANGFVGYYVNADGTSDMQWWFQTVNTANINNQYPFYNLTAGIGQQYNATWCRGPGINGGHDIFHRGKMLISIADNWIQRVGEEPDFNISFMPFYLTTSIFVVLAIIYQYFATTSSPHSKSSKDSGELKLSERLYQPVVPAKLSPYFLLPAQHLSQRFEQNETKFIVLWSIRLWDFVTLNARRAIGELLGVDVLLLLIYFVMCVAFLTNMMHQYNNIAWGDNSNYAYGYIILWHMTLMFFPISKHSVLLYLFRIPFERAIKYHRWISRMTCVWIAVHFATMSYNYYDQIKNIQLTTIEIPTLWHYLTMSDDIAHGQGIIYGTIAGFLALAIFVTSLSVVRRNFYASFYISHILCFPAFLTLAILHNKFVLYFALPPLGLWALDHLVRWMRISSNSSRALTLKYWRVATSKHVRHTVKMEMPANGLTIRPGQYGFLCVPSLSLMWHPFSISSSENSVALQSNGEVNIMKNDRMSFHILGMGGQSFSERMVKLARKLHHGDSDCPDKLPMVLFDGPYGEISVDMEKYSNLVIVAGGIGITAFIGLLNDLVVQHLKPANRKVPLQHVRLVWVTRDSSTFYNWCGDLLDVMTALPKFAAVQLFETDSIQDNEYGFELASSRNVLKLASSSSQLNPDDLPNGNGRAVTTAEVPPPEPIKQKKLSPPLAAHNSKNSVELSQVVFHMNAVTETSHLNGTDIPYEINIDKVAEEVKVAEEEKMMAEPTHNHSTTMAQMQSITSPPSHSKRFPIKRARPDWSALFAEAENSMPSGSTAVLVCGPQGLVASVHEQATERDWPLHKEFFFI